MLAKTRKHKGLFYRLLKTSVDGFYKYQILKPAPDNKLEVIHESKATYPVQTAEGLALGKIEEITLAAEV